VLQNVSTRLTAAGVSIDPQLGPIAGVGDDERIAFQTVGHGQTEADQVGCQSQGLVYALVGGDTWRGGIGG
jgi:hypothetical protein